MEKGNNHIFKIKEIEGYMNYYFIIVLPGAEYTNIK
jgi:hypothetical protein